MSVTSNSGIRRSMGQPLKISTSLMMLPYATKDPPTSTITSSLNQWSTTRHLEAATPPQLRVDKMISSTAFLLDKLVHLIILMLLQQALQIPCWFTIMWRHPISQTTLISSTPPKHIKFLSQSFISISHLLVVKQRRGTFKREYTIDPIYSSGDCLYDNNGEKTHH